MTRATSTLVRLVLGAVGVMPIAQAEPPPRTLSFEAQAAIAAALYAASATQAAAERIADRRLREARAEIDRLQKEGERARVALVDAQQRYVADIGARDRAYTAEINVYRTAVSDIASGAEGIAALTRFNAGDELGALAVLDRLVAAREKARQTRANIETATEYRRVAALAMEARERGKLDTQAVIDRYLQVTRLDQGIVDDWLALTQLHADNGNLPRAKLAAERALQLSGDGILRVKALRHLGDVLSSQGDSTAARRAYEQSLAVAERELALAPESISVRESLFQANEALGKLHYLQGSLANSKNYLERALVLARQLGSETPSNGGLAANIASILQSLGHTRADQGATTEALKHYQDSLAIFRRLATQDPDSVSLNAHVADTLRFAAVGTALEDDYLNESAAIYRRLITKDPSSHEHQLGLGETLMWLGELSQERGHKAKALDYYSEGLRVFRSGAVNDPTSAVCAHCEAKALYQIGVLHLEHAQFIEAEIALDQGIKILERLRDQDASAGQLMELLAKTHLSRGTVAYRRQQYPQAQAHFEKAYRLFRSGQEQDFSNAICRSCAIQSLVWIGATQKQQGNHDAALRSLEEVLRFIQRRDKSGGNTLQKGQWNVANTVDFKDLTFARSALRGIIEIEREKNSPILTHRLTNLVDVEERLAKGGPSGQKNGSNYARALFDLAEQQNIEGNTEKALARYEQALLVYKDTINHTRDTPTEKEAAGAVLQRMVAILIDDAQFARARQLVEESAEIFKSRLAEEPSSRAALRGSFNSRMAMAEIARRQEDLAHARDLADNSLAEARERQLFAPNDPVWLEMVSSAQSLIARSWMEAGNPEAARQLLSEGVSALEPLADAKSDSMNLQKQIALMYFLIGEINLRDQDPLRGRYFFERARQLYSELSAKNPLAMELKWRLLGAEFRSAQSKKDTSGLRTALSRIEKLSKISDFVLREDWVDELRNIASRQSR